jgi:membrane-associated protease RseP (regulator of RpoE activity)
MLVSSLIQGRGVIFEETIENTGAQEAGLKGVITQINQKEIGSVLDLYNVMDDVDPGDTIQVKTDEGSFEIKTISNPENPKSPFIGISKPKTLFVYKGFFGNYGTVSETTLNSLFWILGLFQWIFILSLGVGVFNLFPIKPLDGGLMLEEIIKYFYKGEHASKIANGISLVIFSLLLTNLIGPSVLGIIG